MQKSAVATCGFFACQRSMKAQNSVLVALVYVSLAGRRLFIKEPVRA